MTRQSSNDRQFCAAQILDAADGQKHCAAQLNPTRNGTSNMHIPAGGTCRTAKTRNISAYARTAALAISAGEGYVGKVAADVVTAVGRRRI
jgi:hypothetical protein